MESHRAAGRNGGHVRRAEQLVRGGHGVRGEAGGGRTADSGGGGARLDRGWVNVQAYERTNAEIGSGTRGTPEPLSIAVTERRADRTILSGTSEASLRG